MQFSEYSHNWAKLNIVFINITWLFSNTFLFTNTIFVLVLDQHFCRQHVACNRHVWSFVKFIYIYQYTSCLICVCVCVFWHCILVKWILFFFACMLFVAVFHPCYGKGPHPLLWAGSWATRGKITVSGILNSLSYCVIFVAYIHILQMWTQAPLYNLAQPSGHGLETHALCLEVNLMHVLW